MLQIASRNAKYSRSPSSYTQNVAAHVHSAGFTRSGEPGTGVRRFYRIAKPYVSSVEPQPVKGTVLEQHGLPPGRIVTTTAVMTGTCNLDMASAQQNAASL